jgi:hypothetical protein
MLKGSLLVAVVAVAAVFPALSAGARSWYPDTCVAVDLCAPVDNVSWQTPADGGTPQLFISSPHGKAFVSKNFPVKRSKDGRVHVCLRYDPFGDLEVTCLLVPDRIF